MPPKPSQEPDIAAAYTAADQSGFGQDEWGDLYAWHAAVARRRADDASDPW